jgi:hypothetical protein
MVATSVMESPEVVIDPFQEITHRQTAKLSLK